MILKFPSKTLPPFHDTLKAFCIALSERLSQEKNPHLLAFAFWLRKSHLHEMEEFFKKKAGYLVPRGLVFHIPPSHIDVMLGYSFIISLLMGNCNVVRVPHGNGLAPIIQDLLNQFPLIKEMTLLIWYGHEEEMTKEISSKADARVIWGGDDTVQKIRTIPLSPRAIDLAFPDRFSFGVINADNYLKGNKEDIALKVYNDIYQFDQVACSSPKLLFWVGDGVNSFYQSLQKVITQKQFQFPLNQVLLKKNQLFEKALTLPVQKVVEYSNELTVLFLEKATAECRSHLGQGLIYHVPISCLEEIASFTTHKDQTMTYFGFSQEEILSFQRILNGKGVTRMVPIGQAHHFEPIWDGQDLFSALTQYNTVGLHD